jgi:hypothetical protein
MDNGQQGNVYLAKYFGKNVVVKEIKNLINFQTELNIVQ